MYCFKCGKEIKDGAMFCNWCGAKTNIPESEQKPVLDNKEATESNTVARESSLQSANNGVVTNTVKKTDNTPILRRIAEIEHSKDNTFKTIIGLTIMCVLFLICGLAIRSGAGVAIVLIGIGSGIGAAYLYHSYKLMEEELVDLRNKLY